MTTPRTAQAVTGAGLAAGILLTSPGIALAAWATSGSGSAKVKATRLPVVTGLSAQAAGTQVTVAWSAASLATGYQVVRYVSGTGTTVAVGAGCSGVQSGTTCTETGVPAGAWQYAVRAVNGNWSGSPGARAAVTVITPAAVTTTFPVDGTTYATATWTGCGLCGTATPSTGSTLTKVEYSLRQVGGKYWSGNNFNAGTEQFIAVTGNLATWSVPFPVTNFNGSAASYLLTVKVTDSSGQTATGTTGFSVDRRPN